MDTPTSHPLKIEDLIVTKACCHALEDMITGANQTGVVFKAKTEVIYYKHRLSLAAVGVGAA